MTTETLPQVKRGGYGGLWRSVPRELVYLFLAFPVSIVGFGITLGLFTAGLGTIVTFFIGVILIIGCLCVARAFGTLELAMLDITSRPAITRPEWQDARARTGFFGWCRAVLGNGHYWLYLLHVMVIDFIVKTITWTLAVVWLAVGLGGITYWIWELFFEVGDEFYLSDVLIPWFDNPALGDSIILFLVGVVFVATLPFITRGLVTLHWFIARGVLGAWRSDALQREVITLNESRGAAQSAEGHSLRRLERDIHDGPQQRLVRLQMDLAAAERQLDADPEKARGLITEAMAQSREALEELRSLSRGFAPPILLDRGLVAALESAADRSPVPVKIVDELGGVTLPQEIERNAYFVASEAMANVAKHSGATEATVRVWTDDEPSLTVAVFDNGSGGAVANAGHGLAGLEERLRGLGGSLDVHSPAGGPTSVVAHLPLPTLEA